MRIEIIKEWQCDTKTVRLSGYVEINEARFDPGEPMQEVINHPADIEAIAKALSNALQDPETVCADQP
jgi:ActR/RegA family two-component response regulator